MQPLYKPSTHYCIRPDYVARKVAFTTEQGPDEYWTASRINLAASAQYYVYRTAAQYVRERRSCRFLDVGCGVPTKVRDLIQSLTDDITLLDREGMQPIVSSLLPSARFVTMDFENAVSLQERFDVIVCSDVIEHLMDPDRLMTFLRDSLQAGGILVISTPERNSERGPNCISSPKPDHVREWSFSELGAYVAKFDLTVVKHFTAPKRRLSYLEELLGRSLWSLGTRRYSGCQIVACTRES